MRDPLPDPLAVAANWLLATVEREPATGAEMTRYALNGIRLSLRSFVLLFSDADYLMTWRNPAI